MKQNKKKCLYICGSCDHEFYLKNIISDRLVGCPRCGEKNAYCGFDYLEDDIDFEDSRESVFMDVDFLTDSEFDDHFNYSEW